MRPRRRYTVGDALEDWLAHGVDGLSERTVTLYRGTIVKALSEELGSVRLTELTASDVPHGALTALAARLSTRTVQIAHNVLVRAIRHAGSGMTWWGRMSPNSSTRRRDSRAGGPRSR